MSAPKRRILLTSFRPWLDHHTGNSSDDLLAQIQDRELPHAEMILLRKLEVDTAIASQKVIAAIAQNQPDLVLCCGMAESYGSLTLESQAFDGDKHYQTPLNLSKLCRNLADTKISHDAGKYVCEGLYFHVLQYLNTKQLKTKAIFVHVPLLTPENKQLIESDFLKIIDYLTQNPDNYLS